MNDAELVVVLDYFGTTYDKKIEPAVFQVWKPLVSGIDGDLALKAAEDVARTSKYFPKVATFLEQATVLQKQRDRQLSWQHGPRSTCGICQGMGWWETVPLQRANRITGEVRHDEQWKPCQQCLPDQHARWMEHNRDRKKFNDESPDGPTRFVDLARDALHGEAS